MATVTESSSTNLARGVSAGGWRGWTAKVRFVDPWLLGAALVLSLIGLVMIYSATSGRLAASGGDPYAFVTRQATSLLLGLLMMVAVIAIDYRRLAAVSPIIYGGAVLALVAAIATGGDSVEANRAISLPGFQFQPSELAKPALILILASLFHSRRDEELGPRALVEGLVLAAVPMTLVMAQPDLGSAMVFVIITAGVLLLARLRIVYMIGLAAAGVALFVALIVTGTLHEYQIDRLTAFLSADEADPLSAGYNVNQAMIAVGSGQFWGKGLGEGTQTGRAFVPENHTDFIFTVIGEELGFVGAGLVLALWALLLLRAIRVAVSAKDVLGTLLAGGVAAAWIFQVFVNIGMTMAIMPITGITLPFVSYGGTSLMGSFLMLGILQNVHMRRVSG